MFPEPASLSTQPLSQRVWIAMLQKRNRLGHCHSPRPARARFAGLAERIRMEEPSTRLLAR
jgi:hypothetical protein